MPASASYATTTSVWLEMSPIRSSVERAFPSPIKHRFQKYPHATHESQNPLSAVFHKLSLIFSPLVGTLKTICLGDSCDGSGGAHTGYTGNVHAPLSPATARATSIHSSATRSPHSSLHTDAEAQDAARESVFGCTTFCEEPEPMEGFTGDDASFRRQPRRRFRNRTFGPLDDLGPNRLGSYHPSQDDDLSSVNYWQRLASRGDSRPLSRPLLRVQALFAKKMKA